MTELVRYDAACAALAAAVSADEVMRVHLDARAIEAVAKVAKNFDLEIDAVKLRVRAEARLGEMLNEGEASGIIAPRGGQRKGNEGSASEPSPATLKEIGVDKKLSSRSRKLGGIGDRAVAAMLARMEDESRKRGRIAMDVILGETAKRNAESRRKVASGLSDETARFPSGRRFPVIYADPPWARKAGIGNRAYENHYRTMSWADICALPVASVVLPDAWLFLWIPRAHLLAPHPVEIDTPLGRTTVKMPLAWAVAQSWGFDQYSTCFVWTKTDEASPEAHGTGLIAWDQDELLLMFKRGRGLPKPDAECKYGSNHREAPAGHSAKPDFYREMIRAMATDGVQVLELFARDDPERPWPKDWYPWGNEATWPTDATGAPIEHDADGEVVDDLPSPLPEPPDRVVDEQTGQVYERMTEEELLDGLRSEGLLLPDEHVEAPEVEPKIIDEESFAGVADAAAVAVAPTSELGDIPTFLRRGHPDCRVGRDGE